MNQQAESNEMNLVIAGIGVSVLFENPKIIEKILNRYPGFQGAANGSSSVSIRVEGRLQENIQAGLPVRFRKGAAYFEIPGFQGYFDPVEKKGELVLAANRRVEDIDYFLRVVFAILAYEAGGMLFHAAGIVREGRTYLFYGYSGSGKTTVSRLSQNYLVLNDDLLVLLPTVNGWQVYATPFWNPSQVRPTSQDAPLKAMFHLVQDKKVFLQTLSSGQALAQVMACAPVITSDPGRAPSLLARCSSLVASIPVFDLHFLPDDSFWDVIANAGLV